MREVLGEWSQTGSYIVLKAAAKGAQVDTFEVYGAAVGSIVGAILRLKGEFGGFGLSRHRGGGVWRCGRARYGVPQETGGTGTTDKRREFAGQLHAVTPLGQAAARANLDAVHTAEQSRACSLTHTQRTTLHTPAWMQLCDATTRLVGQRGGTVLGGGVAGMCR